MRAQLGGVWSRFVYHGDRVLEQTDDAGNVVARYTTESSSFYQPLLHLWVASGSLSRHPLYDAQGTARRLADDSGAKTDCRRAHAAANSAPRAPVSAVWPPAGVVPRLAAIRGVSARLGGLLGHYE